MNISHFYGLFASQKNRSVLLFRVLAIAIVVAIGFGLFPSSAQAAVADWHQGVTIVSEYESQLRSDNFKQSIRNLKEVGVTHVSIVLEFKQDGTSNSLFYRHWRTPSDATLRDGIDYIHSQDLDVVLKPHIDPEDGTWRAHIKPNDRDTWYRNYEDMLVHYARIAQEKNVDGMIIGSELIKVASSRENSDNERRWREMISAVREEFSGWLTYSANWGSGSFANEKTGIEFWDALDYLGISAYYPLTGSSKDDYVDAWGRRYSDDIRPFQQENGNMPIMFTEVGYRSVEFANNQPWDGWGDTSQQKQADLYRALFEYWDRHDSMKGVSLWHWEGDPNAGGDGDRNFTPQNKEAEEVMAEWFVGSGGGNGGTPPPPSAETSFDISGNDSDARVGNSTTISFNVKNTGDPVSNAIVDLEIYGQNGAKVHQEYKTGQSFTDGQQRGYDFSWQPQSVGEYRVAAAVFSNSWSLYTWENSVGTVTVTQELGDPDFSVAGGSSPETLVLGESTELQVRVRNDGESASDVIVDAEVYNEQGVKVHQEYRTGQSFGSGDERDFSFDWKPNENGAYQIKAGIFTGSWSLYTWNNDLGNVSVSDNTTLPDEIDVAFPSIDGQTMGETETFRARLVDTSPLSYTMHWRVGSGQLVEMSEIDGGYKTADVNFSNWSWKSDGVYMITFVAKDMNNDTVAEYAVEVRVP
ncbi:MAG: CARDB domain-containing protein [Candidatus Paceibacterota bacterium]